MADINHDITRAYPNAPQDYPNMPQDYSHPHMSQTYPQPIHSSYPQMPQSYPNAIDSIPSVIYPMPLANDTSNMANEGFPPTLNAVHTISSTSSDAFEGNPDGARLVRRMLADINGIKYLEDGMTLHDFMKLHGDSPGFLDHLPETIDGLPTTIYLPFHGMMGDVPPHPCLRGEKHERYMQRRARSSACSSPSDAWDAKEDPLVEPVRDEEVERAANPRFPSPYATEMLIYEYLSALSNKKVNKALVSQRQYDMVRYILMNPDDTNLENAQYRHWTRKMFSLTQFGGEWVLLHNGKPVATRENIYEALVHCHGRADHGGRDKTSGQVRHTRHFATWTDMADVVDRSASFTLIFLKTLLQILSEFVPFANPAVVRLPRAQNTMQRPFPSTSFSCLILTISDDLTPATLLVLVTLPLRTLENDNSSLQEQDCAGGPNPVSLDNTKANTGAIGHQPHKRKAKGRKEVASVGMIGEHNSSSSSRRMVNSRSSAGQSSTDGYVDYNGGPMVDVQLSRLEKSHIRMTELQLPLAPKPTSEIHQTMENLHFEGHPDDPLSQGHRTGLFSDLREAHSDSALGLDIGPQHVQRGNSDTGLVPRVPDQWLYSDHPNHTSPHHVMTSAQIKDSMNQQGENPYAEQI